MASIEMVSTIQTLHESCFLCKFSKNMSTKYFLVLPIPRQKGLIYSSTNYCTSINRTLSWTSKSQGQCFILYLNNSLQRKKTLYLSCSTLPFRQTSTPLRWTGPWIHGNSAALSVIGWVTMIDSLFAKKTERGFRVTENIDQKSQSSTNPCEMNVKSLMYLSKN